ncbi:serine protease HTRA1B-like [Neosynchiropus ocellatus]
MKFAAYLLLLTTAVHAGLLRPRHICSEDCVVARCPATPQSCFHGQVKDSCGCCAVCAAGEGEVCGGSRARPCGDGLLCDTSQGGQGRNQGSCVCVSVEPVCGSDGRTYPSICRLSTENRRAQVNGDPPVIMVKSGHCDSGLSHPESRRFKFNFIADVVDKIIPAVVHLELFQREAASGEDVPVSSGSGFIVSEDGWIVTNAHVLANKHRIKVELRSGTQYEATVKDADQLMDIALIKIEPDYLLPVLPLGQSSDLRPGEFVVAIGSPFSLQNTITTGIISTVQRKGQELGFKDSNMDYIQTDAHINYGNSGGPLVNLDGDVIGMNTLKVAAGISFAIPANRIRQFLSESYSRRVSGESSLILQCHRETQLESLTLFSGLKEQEKKYIGVRMLQLTPSVIQDLKGRSSEFPDVSSGVYVYEVVPGAAASLAGIINHDVIININGRPVSTTQEVSEAVQTGGVLTVVVRRKRTMRRLERPQRCWDKMAAQNDSHQLQKPADALLRAACLDEWLQNFQTALARFAHLLREVPQMAPSGQQIHQMLSGDMSISVSDTDDLATDVLEISADLFRQWEAELLRERLKELYGAASEQESPQSLALSDTGSQMTVINDNWRKACIPHIEVQNMDEILDEDMTLVG